MPFTETLKTMVANKKVEIPATKKKTVDQELSEEPKPQPNQFPGDYMDAYKAWESALSPEAKKEKAARRQAEEGINTPLTKDRPLNKYNNPDNY